MFITSILDYCNSLFYSLLNSLTLKLQRIQKACAHLVYSVTKFCLWDLHWLPVKQLIDFKIILITFKILNNMAPSHLSSLICVATPSGSLFLWWKLIPLSSNEITKDPWGLRFHVCCPKVVKQHTTGHKDDHKSIMF